MTVIPAYKWSKEVRELDGGRCVVCGSTDRVEAHHIQKKSEYPELACVLENGISLCHSCHLLAHGGVYARKQTPCKPISNTEAFIVTQQIKDYQENTQIITLPKGRKEVIQAHAEARGESVNGFINRAISETMERDNAAAEGA